MPFSNYFRPIFDLLRTIYQNDTSTVEGGPDGLSFNVNRRKATEQFLRKLGLSEI